MSEEKRGVSPEEKLDALWCRADELKNTVAQAEADAKKRASHYSWALLILAAVLLTAAVANQCSSNASQRESDNRNNAAAAARQEDRQEHEREMQKEDKD